MDRKRLRKNKPSGNAVKATATTTPNTMRERPGTPPETTMDFMGNQSPDFLGSQECFRIGWDWNAQVNGNPNKPSIRLVQAAPKPKINDSNELLQCLRPRRLVRKRDPDIHDASLFSDQLKSLAACCKSESEEVASNVSPVTQQSTDVLLTPTIYKKKSNQCDESSSVKMEEMSSPISRGSKFASEKLGNKSSLSHVSAVKERLELKELLDESLGDDVIKFTQEAEQDFSAKANGLTTPQQTVASCKKKRLSLSSRKTPISFNPKSLCRRMDSIECSMDVQLSKPVVINSELVDSKVGKNIQDKQNNNGSVNIKDGFDGFEAFDENVLLSLGALDNMSSEGSKTLNRAIPSCEHHEKAESVKSCFEEDDDFMVSPDVLNIIDSCEKKATQDQAKPFNSRKLSNSPTILDVCDVSHARWLKKLSKEAALKTANGDAQQKNAAASNIRSASSASSAPTAQVKAPLQMQKNGAPSNVHYSSSAPTAQVKASLQTQKNCAPSNVRSASSTPTVQVKAPQQVQKNGAPSNACSVSNGQVKTAPLKCTPEEIERKRQEALKKRLKLRVNK